MTVIKYRYLLLHSDFVVTFHILDLEFFTTLL